MKKKTESPFEQDALRRVSEDKDLRAAMFEDLAERPLAVQLAMLRRLMGISQSELATRAHVRQPFISKLEKENSDHRISVYIRLAKHLKGRLAIIPEGSRIVFPKSGKFAKSV